jgi:cell division transport system permease protein
VTALWDVVRRAFRGMREHTYLSMVTTGVVMGGALLIALGALVRHNVAAMVGTWESDAHVSAYFQAGTDGTAIEAARAAVAARPEVADVQLVTSAAAQAWLTDRMPEMADVARDLGDSALPASLEITLRREHTQADALEAFARSLSEGGEFVSVDYGREWVARAETLLALLGALGAGAGLLVLAATIFLIANTVDLVVYARRDELEITRLVGGTDAWILGPFALQGALEGAVGAGLASALLYAIFRLVASRLHDMLALAFGKSGLQFLPPESVAALVLVGAALGALTSLLAARRFLARIP